jgi:hypothetical protein
MFGARGRHRADHLVGVRIDHVDTLVGIDERTCDPHLFVPNGLSLHVH